MTHKPSQPEFPVPDGSPLSGDELERGRTYSRRVDHDHGRSAAEIFTNNVRAIRGDTGTLSLRTILPAQLAHSLFISQFPPDARPKWTEVLTELMITAKGCVADSTPVEFYRKFRQFKEEEESRPVGEKLLFIQRLASALTGTPFTYKNGSSTSTWRVEFCSSADLESAAPSLAVKSDSGESQKVQLIHVMAGLKIE